MKNLCPISLCNVVYKVLTKVLCNRLKSVLPELTDKSQSAFTAGRSTQDNNAKAYELIHTMKTKTKGKFNEVTFEVDISKAYDRVDCNYLEGILCRLGSGATWIRWMMLCDQTVRYSFRVNDDIVGPLTPGRGL